MKVTNGALFCLYKRWENAVVAKLIIYKHLNLCRKPLTSSCLFNVVQIIKQIVFNCFVTLKIKYKAKFLPLFTTKGQNFIELMRIKASMMILGSWIEVQSMLCTSERVTFVLFCDITEYHI